MNSKKENLQKEQSVQSNQLKKKRSSIKNQDEHENSLYQQKKKQMQIQEQQRQEQQKLNQNQEKQQQQLSQNAQEQVEQEQHLDPEKIMLYSENCKHKETLDAIDTFNEKIKMEKKQQEITQKSKKENEPVKENQNQQDYLNISDHLRQKDHCEKPDGNEKTQKIKFQNPNISINEKIAEIYEILKLSKLQFQKEQYLAELNEYEMNGEFDRLTKPKELYKSSVLKHARPFIRAVPSGKLFQHQRLLEGDENRLKEQEIIQARSLSPKLEKKEEKEQEEENKFEQKQKWKPGGYYPRLFQKQTLLVHRDDDELLFGKNRHQTFKDSYSNSNVMNSSNSFLKKIDKTNQFLLVDEMEYDCVETHCKTVAYNNSSNPYVMASSSPSPAKKNQFQDTFFNNSQQGSGSSPHKLLRPNAGTSSSPLRSTHTTTFHYFYDTNSFAKKREERLWKRQDQLFKEFEMAQNQQPMRIGMKTQYFSQKAFLDSSYSNNNKEERTVAPTTARSCSPNKPKEAGWRIGHAVPILFDDMLKQNKRPPVKVKRVFPKTVEEKLNRPRQIEKGEVKDLVTDKRFYYKPHFSDLHNNKFQDKFEQQMFGY